MALSVYVVTDPFGDYKEGDTLQLDSDKAQPLVDAGLIAEATAEDVAGTDDSAEEAVPQDAALVQRAVRDLGKKFEDAIAKVAGNKTAQPNVKVAARVKEDVFRNFGDLCKSLVGAKKEGIQRHYNKLNAYKEEIRQKVALGANETNATEGGYFIKPEWRQGIFDKVRKYPDLISMTERIQTSGNQLNINAFNETSLADGSRHSGVRGYWQTEAAALTASKPAEGQVTCTLGTNVVLVYVTNQLLEDANVDSFDAQIKRLAGDELRWQENESIVKGSGTGQPLGILNQTALVTVTKSANDTSNMFGFRDLSNMNNAMYEGSYSNAVWLVTPEARSTLTSMVFEPSSGSATTYPAFGGVSYDAKDDKVPYRIFGRPVIFCQNCSQLGLVGDIIFTDLSQLTTAEHPQLYIDFSEHVAFTSLQCAFRFYRRFDVRSPWLSALGSKDLAYNFSPMVVLQSRGT